MLHETTKPISEYKQICTVMYEMRCAYRSPDSHFSATPCLVCSFIRMSYPSSLSIHVSRHHGLRQTVPVGSTPIEPIPAPDSVTVTTRTVAPVIVACWALMLGARACAMRRPLVSLLLPVWRSGVILPPRVPTSREKNVLF
jgi:hypothetical protein